MIIISSISKKASDGLRFAPGFCLPASFFHPAKHDPGHRVRVQLHRLHQLLLLLAGGVGQAGPHLSLEGVEGDAD